MADVVVVSSPRRPQEGQADGDIQWPSQDNDYLCQCAREHFVESDEAEGEWRERARDDLRFSHGEQWHPALLAARAGRQCLVIDRAGTPIRQIVNEGRQNRPGIIVSPVDSNADPETAKMIRGLIRNIEQQSSADIAYTTSRQAAVTMGRGYVRILPVYVDDFSFQQELRIVPIRNIFSVRLDPHHQQPDGSDANWCLIIDRMSRSSYEQQFGKLPAETAAWASTGDSWITSQEVQIAEYWWREWHPMELAQLANGMVKPADMVSDEEKDLIMDTRTARVPQVWYAKINGYDVLHKSRWQGRYLPIAQQVGECYDLEGKIDYQGLIRRLKDPQRQYNYWESAKAEMIALAPKAPFIAAIEQIEGYTQYWSTANTQSHSYLPYKAVSVGGTLLPPPQRSSVEPPVQAMVQGAAQAADEIKAISGYYDPALGDQSPDQSGVALSRRQQATNTASFHYSDNERWCIRHIGRILLDAIPYYYSGERTERIVGDDDQVRQVILNQEHKDPETGEARLYDVTVGRYDIAIDAGPSFQTKRQEAVAVLSQLLAAAPQLLQIIGDDFLGSLDVDLAQHMAERMRKTMPPALLEGEPNAEKYKAAQEQLMQLQQLPMLQQQLQKSQQQMMQMQQAVESLTQTNQALSLEVQNKQGEQQLEGRKLEIEAMEKKARLDIEQKELDIKAYEAYTDRLKVQAANDKEGQAA